MKLKSNLKVFVGIPWLKNNDRYSEYLPSCLKHLKEQECPVKIDRIFKTTPTSTITEPGTKRLHKALTDKLNEIVDAFMRTDCSHLWIIDSDVEVPKNALCSLIYLNVDIASGLYSFHNERRTMMAGPIPEGLYTSFKPQDIGYIRGKILGKDGFVGAGNGCMLIKRRVFERQHKSYAGLRFRTDGTKGSDVQFWYDAQAAGFTARINCNIICGHLPQFPLSEINDFE